MTMYNYKYTPPPPNYCPFRHLMVSDIRPAQNFKGQIRSQHDIAHLHPLTNVPAKYQLPVPYSF